MIVDIRLTIDGLIVDDCSDIDKLIDKIKEIADTSYDIQYEVLGYES